MKYNKIHNGILKFTEEYNVHLKLKIKQENFRNTNSFISVNVNVLKI